MLSAWILLVLALLGLANAVYFALVFYRVIQPDSARMPSVCRLGQGTCQSVVFSRDGSLFGVPNSIPGIAFYLLLIGVAASRLVVGQFLGLDVALAGAVLSVALGIYLTYSLLVKLRTPCPL